MVNELEIRDRYSRDGYVIFEKLISPSKIDGLLNSFENFKKTKLPFYSQSIHTWIAPPVDSNGFMQESMESFTRVLWLKGLAKKGNDILLSNEIHNALRILNPSSDLFIQWQNMLFDKSTGTIDHYDSYYLDTMPIGHLIGVWVALEDIKLESGPFRVYPGSHNEFLDCKYDHLKHDDFRVACQDYADKHSYEHALLKKGDVLMWHPSLMHGSSNQLDPAYSRKSLTSHYYPYGYGIKGGAKNRGLAETLLYTMEKFPTKIGSYPILSSDNLNRKIRWGVKGVAIYLKNRLLGRHEGRDDNKRSSYGL